MPSSHVAIMDGQQLCVVCSDLANGLHYGAITCRECNQFFQRGMTNHPSYLCDNEKNCVIKPRASNACRYCRYQKCLKAGMSQEAIQRGRTSNFHHTSHNQNLPVPKMEPHSHEKEQHLQTSAGLGRVVPSVTYVTKSEASEAVVAISSGVEDKRSIIKEDSLGEDGSTVTAIIHDIPSASLIEIVDEIDDKASITKTESLAAVFVIFNEIDDKASITKTETQDSDTSKSVMSSTTNTRRGTDNDNSAEYLVLRTANIKQISTVERLPQDQSNSVSKTILFNCKLCDFQAFNNPQLQSHELWHKEHHQERNNAKPFRCPYCPCVVSTFADFRFHAQFHKRGVMMKYFKCASCTFRCDSEDIMGMHCVSDEKTEYEESGIDDDTVTYIEMVTFHMGRFACPMELCGESFQVVESLLQHCLYQHEGQLADKHLLDFYECPQPVSTSISKMPAEGVIEDTDNAVDRHLCESCGYEARCFSELYRHMTENHKTTCYTVAEDNATSESSETETTRSNPSTLDLSLTIAETRNNANNYLDNENEIPMLETDLTGSESKISNNSCANDVMENINLEINEVDSKSLGTKKSSCFQHAVPEDDLTCDLCRDLIDIENVMASRLKQHRRFHVNFSGSAFQCGYCSHLAYEKETIALHLASVHVDFQPKLLAVLMENGEVMSKEMVNMKGSRFYRPPVGDTTYELDNILEQMCSRPHSSTSGSTSENRGNDDHPLTHHDHIFCSKVVGLKLFRCNLCSFMSELVSSVRVHYLVEHRNHMPLLCGRCFKTVNVKSLRKHHFQHHAQHSLAVIRIVYGNNGTTYENTGNQPDLMRREFEVTEEVDATGRNDWHAATLNLCSVDVRENVLICKFCSFNTNLIQQQSIYRSENLAEISQHVLPQHFRQCPLVCHYCHFGTVLISKMKIHMINHHSTLPFRIRRVLPIQPTEEEILLAKRTQRNRCDGIRKSLEALAGKKRRASSDKEDREDRVRQGASVLDEDPRLQKMYLCQYCEFVSCKSIHSVKHHIVCFHLNYRVHNCDYCTFGSRVLESMLNHLKKEHPTLPCSYTHVGAFKHAAQEYIEEMGNVTVVALFDFDGKAVRRLEHAQARLYCEYALQQNGYKIKGQNKKKTTNLESNKEAEGIEPSTSPMENEKENTKLRGPSLRRYVAPLNSCFRCKLCGEAYTTAKALKYHITRIHWKLYPIMCPLCGFGDFKRMKVDQHIMSAHPGSEVKPQIIPSFRHKELQQLVIVPEEPIKKRQMATSSYACALCSHTTHDHFIMRRHVMIHMKYEPFRCPHCDLSSVEKYQIKKHMEKVHKDTKGAPLTVKDMEKELQIENNISKTKTPGLQQRRATNKLEKSDGEISENEESVTEEERREESVPKERNPNHVPTEEHVPKSQKCPDCEFSATSVRYFYQHVNLMHKTYSETLETADFNEDNNPPSDNDVPLRHAETMTVNTQPKANFTKGAPYTKLNRQCKEARFASPIYSTNSFIDCQPQASNRRKITKSRVRASSPVESITSNSSFTASSSEASDRSSRRDSESSDRTIDDFSDASSVVSEKSSMGKQDLIMCCFACSYRTHAEINLLAHIQQHRDFGEKLECRFCEHVMKEYLEHEDHVKSHVRSRPYRCSRCNKCFKLHRKALDHCTRDHVGRRKARVEAVEIMDNIRNTLRRERKRQLETLHMHPKVFIKDYNVFNENCS